MSLDIVPVTIDNVKDAIECAYGVFKPSDHFAIRHEFGAAVGLEPESSHVRDVMKIHRASYLMALKDGQPAGFSGYYSHVGHEEDVWLGWTGVGANFGRLGIGEATVAAAFKSAKFEGIKSFRIWTTNEQEYDAARRLYARMGFAEESYRASANQYEGASLVRVFSKAVAPKMSEEQSWELNAYELPDLEIFEMDRLNNLAKSQAFELAYKIAG